MQAKKLTPTELQQSLLELPGWKLIDGKLQQEFCFSDFLEAFSFMCRVALLAERFNHHPDWSNVYQRVHISLFTHDLGCLSTKDLVLARHIDQAAVDKK